MSVERLKYFGVLIAVIVYSNMYGQRNGMLSLELATEYHYNYYSFTIIDLETKAVLSENDDYYYPKRNLEGKVIIQHPQGITDTVFIKLRRKRDFKSVKLKPTKAFLDSMAAVENDIQWRVAKIKNCSDSSGSKYTSKVKTEGEETADENMKVVHVVEGSELEEPIKYPGGLDSMYRELLKHIRYPVIAQELGISGKVYLKFVINELGAIQCATVIHGIPDCKECDDEALKSLIYLKEFEPAKLNGKPVKSYYTLPIKFSTQ